MPILAALIMPEQTASVLRTGTTDRENRLDPRLIEAGLYAGSFALARRVLDDPAFEAQREILIGLEQVNIDVEAAWPPPEGEE